MNGMTSNIGRYARRTWRGLFQVSSELYAAGILCESDVADANGYLYNWFILNTETQQIEKYDVDEAYVHCRILFFEPPPKCEICDQFWDVTELMTACPVCQSWMHNSCINDRSYPANSCRSAVCSFL